MTALSAGLGLKPEHFDAALRLRAPTACGSRSMPRTTWSAGGPRLRWLEAIRASAPAVAARRLAVARRRCRARSPRTSQRSPRSSRRIQPALISEHLAWSRLERPTTFPTCCRSRAPPTRCSASRANIDAHAGRARPADRDREPLALPAPRGPRAGTRSSSWPSSRAAPAARCCSTSTTCTCRRATWASTPRLPRPLSRRRSSARSISPAISVDPTLGDGPADRLARCAGRAGRLGALSPLRRCAPGRGRR